MKEIRNLSHSVHDRLLNLAHRTQQPYDLVLVRYALERLLYRLSCSEYQRRFVLKGAFLFAAWREAAWRPTRDMDLLGYGSPDVATLVDVFRALCVTDVPGDGLEFVPVSVRGEDIREGDVYHGVRIHLTARLASALIPLQVDVGFGDVITPPAEALDFPTLLDFPMPHVMAYPKAAVVAEKFEALVTLGMANSRMKDFYDLWMLAQRSDFDGAVLSQALQATSHRLLDSLDDRVVGQAIGGHVGDGAWHGCHSQRTVTLCAKCCMCHQRNAHTIVKAFRRAHWRRA